MVERETAQTAGEGPQSGLSGLKDVMLHKQPGCWLRGSHHLKSA